MYSDFTFGKKKSLSVSLHTTLTYKGKHMGDVEFQ